VTPDFEPNPGINQVRLLATAFFQEQIEAKPGKRLRKKKAEVV
jgi:hypothetical protein